MKYKYINKIYDDVKIIIILIKYQKENFGLLEYFPLCEGFRYFQQQSPNSHKIWEPQIPNLYNCPYTEGGGSMFHRSVGVHLSNQSVLHNTEHNNMSDDTQHNTLECPQPNIKASNPRTLKPATKHLRHVITLVPTNRN
jgi:hypothetical protein